MSYEKEFFSQKDEIIELADVIREDSEEDIIELSDPIVPMPQKVGIQCDKAGVDALSLEGNDADSEADIVPLEDCVDHAVLSSAASSAENCLHTEDQEKGSEAQTLKDSVSVPDMPEAEKTVPLYSGEDTHILASLEDIDTRIRALTLRIDDIDRQLAQQIADAGAMFLNDVSVRLGIEEMVSHMLDVRFPEGETGQQIYPGDNTSVQTEKQETQLDSLYGEIADIRSRLDHITVDMERTAAAVAAQVIREEISVLTTSPSVVEETTPR